MSEETNGNGQPAESEPLAVEDQTIESEVFGAKVTFRRHGDGIHMNARCPEAGIDQIEVPRADYKETANLTLVLELLEETLRVLGVKYNVMTQSEGPQKVIAFYSRLSPPAMEEKVYAEKLAGFNKDVMGKAEDQGWRIRIP